jgi:hypothetical protein
VRPAFLDPVAVKANSIVLSDRNALNAKCKCFPHATRNRLRNPSEIFALEFKGEFRRFKICSVMPTIGTDRRFSGSSGANDGFDLVTKRPSSVHLQFASAIRWLLVIRTLFSVPACAACIAPQHSGDAGELSALFRVFAARQSDRMSFGERAANPAGAVTRLDRERRRL